MRILIVTHAPLRPEYGAAQMAINLAAALRDRGHDAIAWSTEPLPRRARFWNSWLWQRRRLAAFLVENPPFDVIDLPAVSISRKIRRSPGRIVARSVQPDLRYFACALRAELRRLPASLLHVAVAVPQMLLISAAILAGWRRAGVILCLGSHEVDWMRKRFPWTRKKLVCYLDAPSPADQELLAGLRARRAATAPRSGLRFLWIGRWVPQKGTRLLLRFLVERARSHPEDRFTIAGCGDQAVRDCPPELIAAGRLRLVPGFPRAELPGLLAEHDVGLFTSSVEGWGLCLNEMLESGLPVFATPAGGVEDLRASFPRSLRPFPPPLDLALTPPSEDLETGGYYAAFSWAAIAGRYEAEVLSRIAGNGKGAA